MKELGFFIVFSVIFHFLVTTSSLYMAEKLGGWRKKPDVTQIEIIEQTSPEPETLQEKLERTKQMVKQLKTTVEELKDSKTIARFDSEKTQRVKQETKAAQLGVSQNAANAAKAAQMKKLLEQQKPIATVAQNEKTDEEGDQPEFARSRPNVQQMPFSQNSAISSNLPNDISTSNATNLNTDANTFYSFYSRVEDLFYVRWVERVRYYWDRVSFDYKKNVLSGKIWSTTVEIWLDARGEFHSAYIKQSSGYKPFDEAAVFAFKNARFFPNPPKAKVEPDGFVRLRYRFNIHVDAY